MLSGCVAFTVHSEGGVKVAYYGIRIGDRKAVFHKSFNPELYLFGYHAADQDEEVLVTTDMFSCVRHLAEEKQSVCNFGLPYLSPRQLELISPFPRITFEWLLLPFIAMSTISDVGPKLSAPLRVSPVLLVKGLWMIHQDARIPYLVLPWCEIVFIVPSGTRVAFLF
jgi:hypothetical protein